MGELQINYKYYFDDDEKKNRCIDLGDYIIGIKQSIVMLMYLLQQINICIARIEGREEDPDVLGVWSNEIFRYGYSLIMSDYFNEPNVVINNSDQIVTKLQEIQQDFGKIKWGYNYRVMIELDIEQRNQSLQQHEDQFALNNCKAFISIDTEDPDGY